MRSLAVRGAVATVIAVLVGIVALKIFGFLLWKAVILGALVLVGYAAKKKFIG